LGPFWLKKVLTLSKKKRFGWSSKIRKAKNSLEGLGLLGG